MNAKLPFVLLRINTLDAAHAKPTVQLLDVWLAAVHHTRMTAIVTSYAGSPPSVYRYVQVGSMDLNRPLRDRVVLLCFDRLVRERLLFGWSSKSADVPNAIRWLTRQLTSSDAKIVSDQIARQYDAEGRPRRSDWRFGDPSDGG